MKYTEAKKIIRAWRNQCGMGGDNDRAMIHQIVRLHADLAACIETNKIYAAHIKDAEANAREMERIAEDAATDSEFAILEQNGLRERNERQAVLIGQLEAQLTAARHDKTCDDLAAVLWTVQIAASEIEPVAANASERFCCD